MRAYARKPFLKSFGKKTYMYTTMCESFQSTKFRVFIISEQKEAKILNWSYYYLCFQCFWPSDSVMVTPQDKLTKAVMITYVYLYMFDDLSSKKLCFEWLVKFGFMKNPWRKPALQALHLQLERNKELATFGSTKDCLLFFLEMNKWLAQSIFLKRDP